MNSTLSTSIRRHDLDWLRLIAIVILLFFHTGMWFNLWDWHVKNAVRSVSFNYWMIWFHFWRMPLLLFISGAGTYMALGKRTPKQFAGERFKRLFIPLVFGMLVVVPPQIYYERINDYNGYWDFYKTVFEFKPYPEGGSLSWHHLWFILYLLLYSLIALPFLNYLRSDKSLKFRERVFGLLSRPVAILFVPASLILITQLILRPYFPEETHDLKDLGYFVFYFLFFLFGMLCYSNPKLWESIGANRRFLLGAAIFILIPFYGIYFHFREIIVYPWTMDTMETAFDVVGIFLSWFTVITVIAYGQHYLNKPHPILKYVNEGLYPFYILHQTVIIAIGYYICQMDLSIGVKFFTIAFLTLASCLIFYALVIRTNNVMRFFFGLKPKSKKGN